MMGDQVMVASTSPDEKVGGLWEAEIDQLRCLVRLFMIRVRQASQPFVPSPKGKKASPWADCSCASDWWKFLISASRWRSKIER